MVKKTVFHKFCRFSRNQLWKSQLPTSSYFRKTRLIQTHFVNLHKAVMLFTVSFTLTVANKQILCEGTKAIQSNVSRLADILVSCNWNQVIERWHDILLKPKVLFLRFNKGGCYRTGHSYYFLHIDTCSLICMTPKAISIECQGHTAQFPMSRWRLYTVTGSPSQALMMEVRLLPPQGCACFSEHLKFFTWTYTNWEFRRHRKWSLNRQCQC